MKRILAVIFAVALLAFVAGTAQAVLIDFESDTAGYKPNNWQSVDSSLVSFSDSNGADMMVWNYGEQGLGDQSLAIHSDLDNSWLIMNFSVYVDYLELWFGNDDPGYCSAGDQAVLTLFDGTTQVGQVFVVMSPDDIMNQNILFSGALFDSATFYYNVTNPALGLTEVVDNITFNPASSTVPIPGAVWLLGSGLIGLVGFRKKLLN